MPHAPTFDCNAVASREGVAPCRNEDRDWVTARMGDEGNMWTGSNASSSRPRGRTDSYVDWSPDPWPTAGAKEASADFAAVIQELVNQPTWSAGNSVALAIDWVSGTGKRRAEAGSSAGRPPELEIAWSNGTPATQLALRSDVAEEMACSDNAVEVGSSDLEMPLDHQGVRNAGEEFNCEQIIGIRFEGMNIANGASVSDAFLTFDVDETPTTCSAQGAEAAEECARAAAAPVSLRIRAQAADDAEAIASAPADLSRRSKTRAEVLWSPRPWLVVHALKRSPDISSVLQEVVNRPGWREGNAILLTVEKASGDGSRIAEAEFGATPSLTYTMAGGERGLPPFELLSTAEQVAAAREREAAERAAAEAVTEAESQSSFYYGVAVLAAILFLLVAAVAVAFKRRIQAQQRRISELEQPLQDGRGASDGMEMDPKSASGILRGFRSTPTERDGILGSTA